MELDRPGLIHLYCGDGKGKTTASLGLIMRASGAGYKIVFVQYFKSWDTCELISLPKLDNVTIIRQKMPHGFTWELDEDKREQLKKLQKEMFVKSIESLDKYSPTLLVMDEVIGATANGYLDSELVLDFLRKKPDNVEVVMTGRDPLPEFVELADYVSDIHKIKHPYDKGILARKGIEY